MMNRWIATAAVLLVLASAAPRNQFGRVIGALGVSLIHQTAGLPKLAVRVSPRNFTTRRQPPAEPGG